MSGYDTTTSYLCSCCPRFARIEGSHTALKEGGAALKTGEDRSDPMSAMGSAHTSHCATVYRHTTLTISTGD